MDHFALRIEPFEPDALERFLGHLSDDVAELPIRLLGADGYGHSFYVKDPDGNTVELKGPPTADQTPPNS
jgi:glyoxylase I family protein